MPLHQHLVKKEHSVFDVESSKLCKHYNYTCSLKQAHSQLPINQNLLLQKKHSLVTQKDRFAFEVNNLLQFMCVF